MVPVNLAVVLRPEVYIPMDCKKMRNLHGKRGATLVEVIAAVLILAIVVTGVLTGIGFSQRAILSQSSQGDAAAQAQNLADTLITMLHGKDEDQAAQVAVSGAQRVDSGDFPAKDVDKQFRITPVHDDTLSGDDSEISGYRIQVAVAYTDNGGKKYVQLTAFAAKDGDAA